MRSVGASWALEAAVVAAVAEADTPEEAAAGAAVEAAGAAAGDVAVTPASAPDVWDRGDEGRRSAKSQEAATCAGMIGGRRVAMVEERSCRVVLI